VAKSPKLLVDKYLVTSITVAIPTTIFGQHLLLFVRYIAITPWESKSVTNLTTILYITEQQKQT
jgi:hypothetical protein